MSNGSKGDLSEESLKHTLRDEASQQIKSKMGSPDKETGNPGPVSSANINGYGTFKKKRSMNGNATVVKTTDQIIDFIEHEPLFDHQEHRLEVMNIIKNYVKEARRKEILAVLDSSVFDEEVIAYSASSCTQQQQQQQQQCPAPGLLQPGSSTCQALT